MATNPPAPPQRVSRNGIRIVAAILIVFAVIALYANVQKLRREKIETVKVTEVVTP